MNLSVIATEMLKFVISVVRSLHVMNSKTSGWSTRRIPIFAPRLLLCTKIPLATKLAGPVTFFFFSSRRRHTRSLCDSSTCALPISANHELGNEYDVAALATVAREGGALFHTDAVQ